MCHECKKVFQVGRVLPTTGQDNYTAGSLQNPQQSVEFKLGQLWLNVDLSNQTNTYNSKLAHKSSDGQAKDMHCTASVRAPRSHLSSHVQVVL